MKACPGYRLGPPAVNTHDTPCFFLVQISRGGRAAGVAGQRPPWAFAHMAYIESQSAPPPAPRIRIPKDIG